MTDHALTPETLAELEQRHDEGLCLCSSSTTDWDVVPALIAAARESERWQDLAFSAGRDRAAAVEQHARARIERDQWHDAAMAATAGEARAEAERDAALAEVAALRERMTALADEWRSVGGTPLWALRAALDVDTAALDAAPADRDDDRAEGGGVE